MKSICLRVCGPMRRAVFHLFAIATTLCALGIHVHAQSFDFSLSAIGPHNVVQGRDMYVKVSGKTLSGAGGNTYLSVQNVPAGISRFWPDFESACCGDGHDNSYTWQTATFDTALRITAANTAAPGNYTIQIVASNNSVTRQVPYTFTVVASPAPTIPPVISSMPAIPNLSNWQSNMTNYGQQVCNYLDTPGLTFNQRLAWVYYDQTRVMYQIADYLPANASYWNACALKARAVYRDEYVLPENGGVAGHWNFTTGLRMDYERTGDTQSKNAALLTSQNASFSADSIPLNWIIDPAFSRETAYAILAKLDAEKLGEPPNSRLVPLVDIALGHMDQWFVSQSYRCQPGDCDPAGNPGVDGTFFIQPFMVGLTMRALIVYYEKTGDPRIPLIIKTAADWLWARSWVAADQSFWLKNWVADPAQAFPAKPGADDLNLLIVPAFAWLYRQTGDATYQIRGDQIFSGGVLGPLSQANLGKGKQFDENYIWSFDYVKWRTASSTSTQPVTWTEVSNAATESDGGITSTTVNTMASAVAAQQLTAGKYWEIVPNHVSGGSSSEFRINTVGNRNVYRRLIFGLGYLTFYDSAGVWQGQTTVTTSSVIKISLEGATLKIYKDGNPTPVYTFADTLNAPLEMQMFYWVTSSNVGAGLTSAVIN